MADKIRKVLSFPQPVPAKADYQRVKSSYSIREIKQMFGLSERTIRRWTETGIIQAAPAANEDDATYDFQALTLFRRVRDMRSQGLTIKQIEAELQGQLSLFRAEVGQVRVARLLTPFEEALLLHEQGDEQAIEFYREAITAGDNVAEAYCNLGIIQLDRGNMVGALDNFTQGPDGTFVETQHPSRLAFSDYFVARTGVDGNHKVCIATIGPDEKLTLDRTFIDENEGTPCVDFDRTNWPHGAEGNAKPHSEMFVVS